MTARKAAAAPPPVEAAERSAIRIEIRKLSLASLVLVKRVTGRSLLVELSNHGRNALDEEMCGALIWLLLSQVQPDVKYAEVMGGLTVAHLERYQFVLEEGADD